MELRLRASDFGCAGAVVDAKPGAVDFYRRHGFPELELVEGQSDARPAPTPMFLALRTIKAALGGAPAERK